MTISLGIVLAVIFAIQLWVGTVYGDGPVEYLFAAGSDPSPGWLLAFLAHSGPRHLFVNFCLIVVYGAVAERLVSGRWTGGVFVIAGAAATGSQILLFRTTGYAGPAAGASGAAFGLVALTFVITVGFVSRQTVGHPVSVIGLSGILILLVQLGADAVSGESALYAHATGAVVGALFALLALRAEAVTERTNSLQPGRRVADESDRENNR